MTRMNAPWAALAASGLRGCLGLVVVGALGLTACRAPLPAVSGAHMTGAQAECPDRLRDQLRLTASALPLALPPIMAAESGSARPQELLVRRVLLAASPAGAVQGARITASTLTVSVVGGTFGGWISEAGTGSERPDPLSPLPRELSRTRALEVIPGQLRIAPFFTATKPGAQTLALDVSVVPGGMARSMTVASLSPLWTAGGQAVAPGEAAVTLNTAPHLSIYSAVEAQVQLDVEGLERSDSRQGSPVSPWACSYETRFTLVDHTAVLPPLWTLQVAAAGKPLRALALSGPATGPFRALFTDPTAAQSLATWLRATSAHNAGGYQLGLFDSEDRSPGTTIPSDRNIGRTFQAATGDELALLKVWRLGED